MLKQKICVLMVLAVFAVPSFAYADITITPSLGSGAPGCETTPEKCYTPNVAVVDLGDTVIFSNTDVSAHTFTSGENDKPDSYQILFDSSLVMSGSSFEWIASVPGQVPYFCMVHPWMSGTITVNGEIEPEATASLAPVEPAQKQQVERVVQDNTVTELRAQIEILEQDNIELRATVDKLETEVDTLKDQIVSMTSDFMESLNLQFKWFASNMSG